MSFWPLAKSSAEQLLRAAALAPAIELGVGDGRFAARLRSIGIAPLCLDLRPVAAVDLIADARRPCFLPDSCGLFTLANVLRHLNAADLPILAERLFDCCAVGGCVMILEDAAESEGEAAMAYRAVLALLAELDSSRGAIADWPLLRSTFDAAFGTPYDSGRTLNIEQIEDPLLPLRWLQAHVRDDEQRARVSDCEALVRKHGMAYGEFNYALYRRGM